MQVTSIFSFSHSVFKKLLSQGRKNQELFGKGLNMFLEKAGFCVFCLLFLVYVVCDFCVSFPLCVVGQCMESNSFFPRSLQLNIFSHFLLILEELTVIVLNLKQVVIQKHLQKAKAMI